MKELSEDSKFNISIKTLVGIGVGLSMLIGMYFTLQADITEAKELPIPEVSKMEFQMKDELVRETIMNTQADVEEITSKIETQYKNGDFGKIGEPSSVAAKNNAINKALQEASDQNSITWQDWATLMEIQTNKLAEAMKPFKITDSAGKTRLTTPAEGYVGLK